MRTLILLALSLTILAISGAMLTDYLSPAPAFCGFRAGCDAVIFSAYGSVAGVPLPVLGIIGFGLFFLLSIFPDRRAFWLTAPLAALAGGCGLALILVQVLVVRRACSLCMLIDLLAIALAAVRLYGGKTATFSSPSGTRRAGWLALAVLAVSAPPLLALLKPEPHAPDEVKAHWIPGKITVVEVMDFECLYCRDAEPVLRGFVRKHGDAIHFVRLVAPGVQYRAAARAYVAARAQGQGENLAQLIFLKFRASPAEFRDVAAAMVDLKEYDRVISDPQTEAVLDRNLAWAQKTGKGLPLIWVQDHLLQGVPSRAALEGALLRAQHGLAKK
jgi:uncharacterized membrane protein